MPAPAKPQVPVHPLVASAVQDSSQAGPPAQPPVKFSGYVGPASQSGKVRLYSTLDDLSHYLEFDESAVVQTAEAPETLLPHKALSIWVKASTPVRWIREYPTASGLAASITSSLTQGGSSGSTSPGSLQ